MKIQIRIGRVDHNGYCGRDYHPVASDEGTNVIVWKLEALSYDTFDPVGPTTTSLEEDWETCLHCKRADGSLVEVMPHEVAAWEVV
jgi:hypothetical protein